MAGRGNRARVPSVPPRPFDAHSRGVDTTFFPPGRYPYSCGNSSAVEGSDTGKLQRPQRRAEA